uniref:Secreted protein n=2 Tax=Picea TaxID=3328 RepID=A0A101LXD4_PICGL|nr:hypothetical protein ABT39_MTgene6117 [Picea glauca]QHR92585.1 hypothetical protein Q903MT_gene6631 [Picea sitchensis]
MRVSCKAGSLLFLLLCSVFLDELPTRDTTFFESDSSSPIFNQSSKAALSCSLLHSRKEDPLPRNLIRPNHPGEEPIADGRLGSLVQSTEGAFTSLFRLHYYLLPSPLPTTTL